MKKVLITTNLPVPYKIDFYNELGKYVDLTVIFEGKRFTNQEFNWNDDDNCTFKKIYLSDSLNEKKLYINVWKYLNKTLFDIFLITVYHTVTALFIISKLRFKQIPYYIETDGTFLPKAENLLKDRIKRFIISGAKGYFSPCLQSDNYLLHYGAQKNKIHRYPFASTLKQELLSKPLSTEEKMQLRKELKIKGEKVIVAVGQFIYRKGFDVLIKALKGLSSKNISCYIIGGSPTTQYLNLIKENDIQQIYFIPFTDRITLAKYYRSADLFVLPTREDIWGLVINEAMANGLPVITTDRCNAGLTLVSETNGAIVPTNNVMALRKSIEHILLNEKLQQNMANISIQKMNYYTIENMAKVHIDIFNESA